MKKKIVMYTTLLFSLLVLTSILSLSQLQTKIYNFKDFTGIEVGSGMHLQVSQSNTYYVEVKADESDLKYIRVEKSGGVVNFYIDKFFWRAKDRITVTVTLPELTDLDLSGGSEGKIGMDISSKSFNLDLSGGSILGGNLICGNISIELSGGSIAELSGKGNNLKIEGSGGSTSKMKGFSVNNVDAEFSGGSKLVISMDGILNVDASGGSKVTYYGKAEYGSTDLSGGSKIKRGE